MRNVYKKPVLDVYNLDKRRFNEIFSMSKGLQRLANEGNKVLPTFQDLLGDTWASLYKMKPEFKEDIPYTHLANRSFMGQLMAEETFEENRELTRMDDFLAAISSVKYGEQLKNWIVEQEKENEEFKKALENARKAQQDINKKNEGLNKDERKKARQQARKELSQAMQDLAQQINSQNGFQNMLTAAIQEASDIKDDLKSLSLGIAGSGDAELKKIPLRHQIALAEYLQSHKKFKEIANWTGRFMKIARSKQKAKHRESIDRSGITFGNNVERILPMELSLLSAPQTKLDFLRRFAEGQTMQYEQKGKESLGKGPILLCLDQSGSMRDLDTQSKGFALALMAIAKKQKREFAIIRFARDAQTTEYPQGKYSVDQMIQFASEFFGGGTEFRPPLNEALRLIEKSRFEKADIVFVTDGEANLDPEYIKKFQEVKARKQFNVLGVLIGRVDSRTVSEFADKIVHAEDFTNATQAFEI